MRKLLCRFMLKFSRFCFQVLFCGTKNKVLWEQQQLILNIWCSKFWEEHRVLFNWHGSPILTVFKLLYSLSQKHQVRFAGDKAFDEIVSSQKFASFNYQQVTDRNKSALQFLFSFYRRWQSVSNFRVEIGSVGWC